MRAVRRSATGDLDRDRRDRPGGFRAAAGADAARAVPAGQLRSQRLVVLGDGVPVVPLPGALLHQLADVAEAERVALHLLDLAGELTRRAEVEAGGAGDL